MKIVFFNRFFFPDPSATSQMASDLAFELASRGHEVHAVASSSVAGTLPSEVKRGVTIHRVTSGRSGGSIPAKAIGYLRFYTAARQTARGLLGQGDVAVIKTDPPMLAAALASTIRRQGAIQVNWLQDLFPEIAAEYGIPGARMSVLRALRNKALASSAATVVIGEAMRARTVAAARLDAAKVHVIENWADGSAVRPMPASDSPLRARWSLQDKFVVLYSGNLGRVHEFDTLLGAAKLLLSKREIVFLIVGSGPRHAEVQAKTEELSLTNVRFAPLQARELLSESLAVGDLHLCVLRPEFEGLVVPSKLYGILAAGRPCVYIGDIEAEAASLLVENAAGIAVAQGASHRLADEIVALGDDRARCSQMGRNARALFEREFDFPVALRKWEALLASLPMQPKSRQ